MIYIYIHVYYTYFTLSLIIDHLMHIEPESCNRVQASAVLPSTGEEVVLNEGPKHPTNHRYLGLPSKDKSEDKNKEKQMGGIFQRRSKVPN